MDFHLKKITSRKSECRREKKMGVKTELDEENWGKTPQKKEKKEKKKAH